MASTHKGQCTEDKVTAYPVGCDDHSIRADGVLDSHFHMGLARERCRKFSICKTPIDHRMAPDVSKPPTGENRRLFRQPEGTGIFETTFNKLKLLRYRPSLIDTDGGKEEIPAVGGLEQGHPEEMIHTTHLTEDLQCLICGERAPDCGIDGPIHQGRDQRPARIFAFHHSEIILMRECAGTAIADGVNIAGSAQNTLSNPIGTYIRPDSHNRLFHSANGRVP